MLEKFGIISSVVLALVISSELFAEKVPESRDEADQVVTAKVAAVYSRTKILDPDSPFKEKRIEYIIELDVMEVHRGAEAKAGKRFYVHCFQRDDSELAPGVSPPPGMSGHREIPKEGQVIKAFTRYAHQTNNGLYPHWLDVLKDVEDRKK